MVKNLFLISLLFFMVNALVAQQMDSTMNIYREHYASEKIHIQTDRAVYRRGETIFYKAYLLSNSDLSTLSKTLYTDWYDESGNLLQQTEAPIFIAGAKGSFDIPENYAGNQLNLISYTKWMLNFDTAFIYNRTINIYRPKNKTSLKDNETTQSLKPYVQLYPEGGFSVAGLNNTIAFKATDQSGVPVNIKGIITNSKGNLVDSFISVHNGMGEFSMVIEKGETYFFNWVDEQGNTGSNKLSAQKQSGACLGVSHAGKKLFFTIQRSTDCGKEFKTLHLLVHKNETLRYKLDIDMSVKNIISSEINLSDLPTGIVQFTLFNANWVPVAERIIFANNQNYFFTPLITIKQKDLSKKGLNEIEISVPDTLLTSMSVAVTDASLGGVDGDDIFSDFLLSDEIKGRVYNPSYYFLQKTESDSIEMQLDLVMLTNGHRRFDWEQIAMGSLPFISYPPDTGYLQIKGQLPANKPFKAKDPLTINVMMQTKDSTKNMLVISIKSNGYFEQDNLFYYDTVKLFYTINTKKNSIGVVKFQNGLMKDAERKNYFINHHFTAYQHYASTYNEQGMEKPGDDSSFFKQQEKQIFLASKTLKPVIVTAKTKTTKQILDDYYTRGMYAGEGNNIAVDVEGDVHAIGSNIWDYLQSKIPGLNVSGYPERIPTWYLNSQGIPGIPAILLDEAPISLADAGGININSVAYVKALDPLFLVLC